MSADALARISEAAGPELVERLLHLDASYGRPRQIARPELPAPDGELDFDVVIAGGGLSVLYAPILAEMGMRVAVLERATAARAHREWNASRAELEPLVTLGILTKPELEEVIVARYTSGIVRWFGGGTYRVRGVLDHAVDAGKLLELTRRRAEAVGVTFLDGVSVTGERSHGRSVTIGTREGETASTITARLMVDARGASSPYATADLACPTVGGVLRGLNEGDGDDEMRPDIGEILATTEDVEDGAQHLWEAFPGRRGETTVYLFRYAHRTSLAPGELVRLYDRFFSRRPGYKRGDAKLLRPTFGVIPGWSRSGAPPTPPPGRVVLVGDAAARHSPLTFCGFGATLRSLGGAARAISRAADAVGPAPTCIVDDRALHSGTGALAAMLASADGARTPSDLNALLDAAFGGLAELGEDAFAALLRDEMEIGQLIAFLRVAARRRPKVYGEIIARLGIGGAAGWGIRLLRAAL